MEELNTNAQEVITAITELMQITDQHLTSESIAEMDAEDLALLSVVCRLSTSLKNLFGSMARVEKERTTKIQVLTDRVDTLMKLCNQ